MVATFASGALKLYVTAPSRPAIAAFTSAATAQVADHHAKGLNAATVTNYGYDANGNETTAGPATLTYDLANRLKTYAAAGTTTSYAYDG